MFIFPNTGVVRIFATILKKFPNAVFAHKPIRVVLHKENSESLAVALLDDGFTESRQNEDFIELTKDGQSVRLMNTKGHDYFVYSVKGSNTIPQIYSFVRRTLAGYISLSTPEHTPTTISMMLYFFSGDAQQHIQLEYLKEAQAPVESNGSALD